ncbi:MAG: type II toxin-antitoxin system RelE/ParE family toxin [Bacteroidota bacterium]
MSNIIFTITDEFEREFIRLKKKYRSLSDDIKQCKSEIEQNPDIGIDLGSNLRKIRFSIKSKGKGKSGGARIITYNIVASIQPKQIILVTLYDKNEIDSISTAEIKQILKRNGF